MLLAEADRAARGRSRTKALIWIAGTILFAASLLFITKFAANNWAEVKAVEVTSPLFLVISAAVYAISHLSTGLSWPLALRRLGEPITLSRGLQIGLVSQAGKYLPGNVVHYIGRTGLAKNAGISLRSGGLSVAVELASALAAACLVAGACLAIDPLPLSLPWMPHVASAGPVALGALAAGVLLLLYLRRQGHGLLLFAAPTACLAVSFLLSGLSFYYLLGALGEHELPVATAVGAFVIAWAAGFVIPGAPAGLGVREAVLIALIAPSMQAGTAVACVGLHRLITALVDAAAAVGGYAWMASTSLSKK